MQLGAEVREAGGRILEGAAVAWSSSDSTVARVDRSSGRVVALRPGRVQVIAANGVGRDSVIIAVRRPGARVPPVASITIAALHPLRSGDSATLRAVVLGPRGDTLPGAEVTWASGNPEVATVEALTGVARGLLPGTALILARSGNQTSLSELAVLPNAVASLQVLGARPMAVRETLALRVTAVDGQGRELTGLPVAWTSSDSTVATVDESGVVVGKAPGAARITAATGDNASWIHLTVLPRPERLRSPESLAEQERIEAWMGTGVDECYGALLSRDPRRLRAVWQPASKADEEGLKRLTRILRTSASPAVLGERLDRAPTIGPEAAAIEFSVPLAWRETSGQARTAQPVFRAEFVRAGGRWEMSSCRVVGPPPT
jgi:Bacterial Ig-like domain (group 2)